jgi:hypothetical protein
MLKKPLSRTVEGKLRKVRRRTAECSFSDTVVLFDWVNETVQMNQTNMINKINQSDNRQAGILSDAVNVVRTQRFVDGDCGFATLQKSIQYFFGAALLSVLLSSDH